MTGRVERATIRDNPVLIKRGALEIGPYPDMRGQMEDCGRQDGGESSVAMERTSFTGQRAVQHLPAGKPERSDGVGRASAPVRGQAVV